jgi:deoxycytidylate deaminase
MFHVAKAAAQLSPLKPKLGACVVKGGRVLGIGYNRYGSTKSTPWSRHAEMTAILSAGDCKGAVIYVYRGHGKTGEPMLAKPCRACEEAIRLAGIKRVIYSEPA